MAKAPTQKLKVFQAQFGFYDTVVAVRSQAAALQAWGVHNNLFGVGLAKRAEDPEAIAAAQAHPGTVLKRPVGTDRPFTIDPTELPKLPKSSKRKGRLRLVPAQPAPGPEPEPPPAPPDRSALDAAEHALEYIERHWNERFRDLQQRQAELDADWSSAEKAYRTAKDEAVAAVSAALRASRESGGAD